MSVEEYRRLVAEREGKGPQAGKDEAKNRGIGSLPWPARRRVMHCDLRNQARAVAERREMGEPKSEHFFSVLDWQN